MASKNRGIEVGYIYHVLNRGALRQNLFFSDSDYLAFENLIRETLEEAPIPIFTFQLMPNHWHFVVKVTESPEQLSDFFHYLSGTHAKRFRTFHDNVGTGHVYQDRFKSFPVQDDDHFITLCRYVERNALRAGLTKQAQRWRWGGLWCRLQNRDDFLHSDWPIRRQDDWTARVNWALTSAEVSSIRTSIRRGRPYGTPDWTERTAEQLDLLHTLRPQGRPRKLLAGLA